MSRFSKPHHEMAVKSQNVSSGNSMQLSGMAQLLTLSLVTDQTNFWSADAATDHTSKTLFHMCYSKYSSWFPLRPLCISFDIQFFSPARRIWLQVTFTALRSPPASGSRLSGGRPIGSMTLSQRSLNRRLGLPRGHDPSSRLPCKMSLGIRPSSIRRTWHWRSREYLLIFESRTIGYFVLVGNG